MEQRGDHIYFHVFWEDKVSGVSQTYVTTDLVCKPKVKCD